MREDIKCVPHLHLNNIILCKISIIKIAGGTKYGQRQSVCPIRRICPSAIRPYPFLSS